MVATGTTPPTDLAEKLEEIFQALPADEQAEFLELVQKRCSYQPIREFIAEVSPHLPPPRHTKIITDIVERAMSEQVRVVISMPPRHGKTITLLHCFAWWIKHNPADTCAYFTYSEKLGFRKSKIARDIARRAGIVINKESNTAGEWLTMSGGGLIAGGRGGGLTGDGATGIFVVDDPFKNRKEADSVNTREDIWEWFTEVVNTRLEGASLIVLHCMAGCTPVLMETGEEKALRDIRPGDRVATYDNGKVSVSTVRNWVNNGPDSVFEIRMRSGTVVKANARHPFLVEEDGETVWQRTDTLKKGSVILKVTGVSGEELRARKMGAMSQHDARLCACPIMPKREPGTVTSRLRITLSRAVARTFAVVTGLILRITSACLPNRAEFAPSVQSRQPVSRPAEGVTSTSSLTTATTAERCEGSCATCAISRSGDSPPRSCSCLPLSTYEVSRDVVVDVVAAGVEDVFDVQIDRTENFIANGLVSHNTRWHEDDLIGRLVSQAKDNPILSGLEVINLPALAEENDPLGRKIGEALWPWKESVDELHKKRALMGQWSFDALFQGRPRPRGSQLFGEPRYYDPDTFDINGCSVVIGADPAATKSTTADYSAAVVIAVRMEECSIEMPEWDEPRLMRVPVGYVLHVYRKQVKVPQFVADLQSMQTTYYNAAIGVEAVAGFKAVPQMLLQLDPNLRVQEMPLLGDKFQRAQGFAAAWNMGCILLPARSGTGDQKHTEPWVKPFTKEVCSFSGVGDATDDQVDAAAHAWNQIAYAPDEEVVRGSFVDPGRWG